MQIFITVFPHPPIYQNIFDKEEDRLSLLLIKDSISEGITKILIVSLLFLFFLCPIKKKSPFMRIFSLLKNFKKHSKKQTHAILDFDFFLLDVRSHI